MGGEEGWPARCTPELPAGDVFLSLQQHLPALRRTRRRTERSARSAQRNSGGCGSALGKGRGGTGGAKGKPSAHRAAPVFPERSSPPPCHFGMRLTHGDSLFPEPIIIIIIF